MAGDAASTLKYRFRVKTADGQEVTSPVIELLARGAGLKNPRWGDGAKPMISAHNEPLKMVVDAPGMDGRNVRFIVERLEYGQWTKHAEATGVVKAGVVSTSVTAKHPAGESKTASLTPVPLRFKVELA